MIHIKNNKSLNITLPSFTKSFNSIITCIIIRIISSLWRIPFIVYIISLILSLNSEERHPLFDERPLQQEDYFPVEIKRNVNGNLFIEFEKTYFAKLELKIKKTENLTKLIIHMGEDKTKNFAVNKKPGPNIRYLKTELTLQKNQQIYLIPLPSKDARMMPPNIGPVMPFRYVEIENCPQLNKNDIKQIAVFYPFNENASSFKSSDKELDKIWELCKHTMKATSFSGIFVDGDRERIPYEADTYINQLGWYYTNNDFSIPRKSLEYLIFKPTWPTEWIMFAIMIAWKDYQFTGNIDFLKKFYEYLKYRTLVDLERDDGLISTPEKLPENLAKKICIKQIHDIVDWPPGERDNYDMKPINTVVNVFHYHVLDLMANIANALNKKDDEKIFRNSAEKTKNSINKKLVNSKTSLYIDGEGSSHSSLHANFFPLIFGITPQDKTKPILQFIKTKGMACSVYAAQFLLETLFDYNEVDYAMKIMTANNDRSWVNMIKKNATITFEAWDEKYKANLDWNHAWGAAPANLIPGKILGIEPLIPGFEKTLIQPRPGHLTWAEGYITSVRGKIYVKFSFQNQKFILVCETPTTTKIGLPKIKNTQLLINGKEILPDYEFNNYIFMDNIPSGKYEIIQK